MNYNANSNVRQPLGRKIKRVSDINAMGPPINTSTPTPFNPYNQYPNEYTTPTPMYSNYSQYPSIPPPLYSTAHSSTPSPSTSTYVPPVLPSTSTYQSNMNISMQSRQFNILSQPVVQDVAYQYGQQLADTGKQFMKSEIERYVPVGRLKYYFAVDTKYVLSKIKLLFFPFLHQDWSVKYEQENPVQPRYEVNAPDLYIPTMAYVTYVLVAGLVLGMQNRFSPEQISILASSALAWSIVEIILYLIVLYVTNIKTILKTLDLVAYSGYKYVGIIISIISSLMFDRIGYYVVLTYCNFSLAFFLMRSLRAHVLIEKGNDNSNQYYGNTQSFEYHGTKRRLYFLLFVAMIQPFLTWWLTSHLISSQKLPK